MKKIEKRTKICYGWWIVVLFFYTLLHTAGQGFYSPSVYMPRIIESLKISTFAFTAAGIA